MKFEIQLFKYFGIAVVGAAYFGVGIPKLISANNDFLSSAGVFLMALGIAVTILFIRREILLYMNNKKGDEEKDESK